MERYALIDCVFLLVAALATFKLTPPRLTRAKFSALAIVVALTLIFDNVMIRYGVMVYNSHYILGLHIGRMPVEDISYTIAAILLVPAVYELLQRRSNND